MTTDLRNGTADAWPSCEGRHLNRVAPTPWRRSRNVLLPFPRGCAWLLFSSAEHSDVIDFCSSRRTHDGFNVLSIRLHGQPGFFGDGGFVRAPQAGHCGPDRGRRGRWRAVRLLLSSQHEKKQGMLERGDSFPCGVTKLTVVSKADCSTPREKSMPATTVLRISRVGNGPEGTVKHWATVWHEQLGWLVHLLTWSRPVPNA